MGKNQVLLFLAFLTLAFQACNKGVVFDPNEISQPKTQLNGEGYSGKPSPYDFRNPNLPCLEKGANGAPLPNSQIFIFPTGPAQLVRENCTDITPRSLDPRDYTIASNGNVIYQNQTFASNLNQGPFDVVAASCPAGKTMLANPVRSSLVFDPLNLQSSVWENGGLTVSWEGTLASLPVYKVERRDPNALEGWRRMAQSATMNVGETYVYSFFARTDPSEKVMFVSYYPNVQDFRVEFDLVTGAAATQSSVGVNILSTKAQKFGGGLYVNIYFQPLSTVHANIGISSSGQFVGSSISTTALQLEKVSNFCSP
jgi:hypothetical protein